jgi:hypothetical protein
MCHNKKTYSISSLGCFVVTRNTNTAPFSYADLSRLELSGQFPSYQEQNMSLPQNSDNVSDIIPPPNAAAAAVAVPANAAVAANAAAAVALPANAAVAANAAAAAAIPANAAVDANITAVVDGPPGKRVCPGSATAGVPDAGAAVALPATVPAMPAIPEPMHEDDAPPGASQPHVSGVVLADMERYGNFVVNPAPITGTTLRRGIILGPPTEPPTVMLALVLKTPERMENFATREANARGGRPHHHHGRPTIGAPHRHAGR